MKSLLLWILLFSPLLVRAQVVIDPQGESKDLKGIIYKNEYSVEFKLHTLGMAIGYNKGKLSTYYKTNFYHFDFGFLKNHKEKKGNIIATSLNIYNSYTYGKANYFFPLRVGKGTRIYLSEKDSRKGLAIGYSLEGGLTLGIMKPYYLWIKTTDETNQAVLELTKYEETNRDIFLDENLIYDKAPFLTGIGESKLVPGMHMNASVHYGIKAYEKTVFAFETGIMLDAFIKKVPVMVETDKFKNNSIFINVFVNVQFGKRWN